METIISMGKIAGIGGLALGVLLILFRNLIRMKVFKELSQEQSYKLLRLIVISVWSIAVAGIVIWCVIPPPKPIQEYPISAAQYGLKLNSIHWENTYKPDGDFVGEIRYKVSNVTSFNVVELLPGSAGWFGWDIEDSNYFKVLGNKSNRYNLSASTFSKKQIKESYLHGDEREMTYFSWIPRLNRGLQPGDSLEYSVVIFTKGTEKAAFTDSGSFLGMATLYDVKRISCRATVPEDYMLELKDYSVMDKTGAEVKSIRDIPRPELSANGSELTWRVNEPLPAANYIAKISISPRP